MLLQENSKYRFLRITADVGGYLLYVSFSRFIIFLEIFSRKKVDIIYEE